MVFGYFPITAIIASQMLLIGDYDDWGFSLFIDDYIEVAISFEGIFDFLHEYYFLWTSFRPVYLAPHKNFIFIGQQDFVRFTGYRNGLWPSIKHRD